MTKKITDELWNSYFYEGTNILINNHDEHDFTKLKELAQHKR